MALPNLQKSLYRRGSGVLYSTVFLPTTATIASTTVSFFGYSTGQVPPGGTLNSTVVETNLRTPSQIPGQSAFTVEAIALQLWDNATAKVSLTAADLHNVLDSSLLFWQYTQAQVQIAPGMSVGAGGGIYGVAGTNLAPAQLNNGAGGVFRLSQPVVLAPLANFTISWQFAASATTPAVTVGAKLILIGSYDQAIEAG